MSNTGEFQRAPSMALLGALQAKNTCRIDVEGRASHR
jgi:hypothetical protein